MNMYNGNEHPKWVSVSKVNYMNLGCPIQKLLTPLSIIKIEKGSIILLETFLTKKNLLFQESS